MLLSFILPLFDKIDHFSLLSLLHRWKFEVCLTFKGKKVVFRDPYFYA